MEKKIIVLGGMGISERRDRDPDRIIFRGGCIYALPAHISVDKPLVVKCRKSFTRETITEQNKVTQEVPTDGPASSQLFVP